MRNGKDVVVLGGQGVRMLYYAHFLLAGREIIYPQTLSDRGSEPHGSSYMVPLNAYLTEATPTITLLHYTIHTIYTLE